MAEDLGQDGIVLVPGKEYCLVWTDALTSGAYEIYQGTTKIGQVGGHYHISIEEYAIVRDRAYVEIQINPSKYESITVSESVTLTIT
jgi:hypothetical protein